MVLNFLRLSAAFFLILLVSAVAAAQTPSAAGQTVLVVPFENQSKAPGIEWVGDSFPELLQERLDSPTLYVVPREDRVRAYDRLGIPIHLRASRATIYRLAEQLDVDYVVLGRYILDGRIFTANAQLLDMHHERLMPQMIESGPLVQLIEIETSLAWDVLRGLRPDLTTSKQQFIGQASPVRLDAFESYIRGGIAPTASEQIHYFREAVRLNPAYSEAWLELGKACYRDREYAEAIASLSHIEQNDPRNGEANF